MRIRAALSPQPSARSTPSSYLIVFLCRQRKAGIRPPSRAVGLPIGRCTRRAAASSLLGMKCVRSPVQPQLLGASRAGRETPAAWHPPTAAPSRSDRAQTPKSDCIARHNALTRVEGHAGRLSEHPDARENRASSQKRPFRVWSDKNAFSDQNCELDFMGKAVQFLARKGRRRDLRALWPRHQRRGHLVLRPGSVRRSACRCSLALQVSEVLWCSVSPPAP